jgi:DNA modification methylase
VLTEAYPPDLQHDLRSEHGGQKPPQLCLSLVERFSKAGECVLDPFAGVGGTLLGASLAEHEGTGLRRAVGFERTERWVDVYFAVLDRENRDRRERGQAPLAAQDLRHGDCAALVADVETDSVDLLLTDVPYWSMDTAEQTRNRRRTRASKLGRFADSASEGPETKEAWLSDLASKFELFHRVLRDGAYVVVFIGDMYRDSAFHLLSADFARALDAVGFTLKADLIWYDPAKPLHVYGYPFAFVPSMVHQHVLVFRT